jgi:hypothetical protein
MSAQSLTREGKHYLPGKGLIDKGHIGSFKDRQSLALGYMQASSEHPFKQ